MTSIADTRSIASDAADDRSGVGHARIILIAAVSDNGVIGRAGELPWHLPADLRHFKSQTVGHTLLMGRRTFESIGRPLPQRRNLVLSRDPEFAAEGVTVVHTFGEALEAAAGEAELFVIGGADVFRAALPRATRLLLTRVHAEVDGDARFPEFDRDEWQRVAAEPHPADEDHAHAFTFETWVRRRDD